MKTDDYQDIVAFNFRGSSKDEVKKCVLAFAKFLDEIGVKPEAHGSNFNYYNMVHFAPIDNTYGIRVDFRKFKVEGHNPVYKSHDGFNHHRIINISCVKPDPPIVINGYEMNVNKNGLKIGCYSIDPATVEKIYEKFKQAEKE